MILRMYKVLGKILNATFLTAKLTHCPGFEAEPPRKEPGSLAHNPLNPVQN